jgi:hypothetical protein
VADHARGPRTQVTGRTQAALAQAVRRFRLVCGDELERATGKLFDDDTLIQGRPGYRLNPTYVTAVRIFPEPPPDDQSDSDPLERETA